MSRAPPPPPPPPRFVALLALCVALPAALAQVTTTYEGGDVGLSPNFVRELRIPSGQCSGMLDVALVCQDPWRPAASLLQVKVLDHAAAYVKLRADLSQALVYRNDGDAAAPCAGDAIIIISAHCGQEPGSGP